MTRIPLMLSDTAMVLLRRYIQLDEDMATRAYAKAKYRQGPPFTALKDESHQVTDALIFELWLLWSFPDLVPTRHLEQHISIITGPLDVLFYDPPVKVSSGGIRLDRRSQLDTYIVYIARLYQAGHNEIE